MERAVVSIMEALEAEPLGPGDIASRLGLPRYRVLGIIHALEELGLVDKIYGRGSYKLYSLSGAGRLLLLAARSGVDLREVLAKALESIVEREDSLEAPEGEKRSSEALA